MSAGEVRERPATLAVCHCGAPLVFTMAFPQKEWICIECGALYAFMSGATFDTTDELWTRYEALKAEWDEHAAPRLRVGRWWRIDCEACKPHGEYHEEHATDEERAAHAAALAWLRERAGLPAVA